MKTYQYILYILAAFLFATACSDDLVMVQQGDNPQNQDKGIGELVLFSSGNAGNATTRAEVCPYMEQHGRFVCKMYYHAKATDTDASPFDTISTPITSWLRVNNNEGNSVYWNKNFTDTDGNGTVDGGDLTPEDRENANYKDYGFDPNAQFFYWRNRLDHVFLGFTDYNKLKTNSYRTTQVNGKTTVVQNSLFMYPERDGEKKTKVGEREDWSTEVGYYKLNLRKEDVPNPEYDEDDKIAAEERGESYDVPEYIQGLVCNGSTYSTARPDGGNYAYYLAFSSANGVTETLRTMLGEAIDASTTLSGDEKTALKNDIARGYPTTPEETAEGKFRNYYWIVEYDYEKADPETHLPDLNDEATVFYCARQKQQIEDIIATAPANTFDLTRGTKTSMAEQPDPLIALTKMKPTGATQEANRVRLHFKHQFSQIQVNLVNAENTAEITAANIVSVELLGVTEKGYVFTNINPDGTQIPPSYDPVIISHYTEEQLKENPHGTSFNMFVMADNAKPATSLKSFNAIAFGQLQAIRITWQEEETHENYTEETAAEANAKYLIADANGKKPGDDGYTTTYKAGYTPVSAGDVVPPVKHVATYKITVDDRGNSLVNLRSGFRYMYDFELRRGTIAFIRATIDGWLLDEDLDFNTSGTINE